MKCAEFEQRFHKLLDHRVNSDCDEQLNAHAQDCANCRQVLAGWSVVRDGMEFAELPEVSTGFTHRIVAGLTPTRHQGSRLPTIIAAVAVVAAVLLVALIPSLQSLISPAPMAPNPAFVENDTDVDPPLPQANLKPNRNEINDLRDSKNAQDLSVAMVGNSIGLPQIPSFSSVSERINSDEIPGVRPIRSSLTVAITLMRRALPGGRENSEPTKPQAQIIRDMSAQHIS